MVSISIPHFLKREKSLLSILGNKNGGQGNPQEDAFELGLERRPGFCNRVGAAVMFLVEEKMA